MTKEFAYTTGALSSPTKTITNFYDSSQSVWKDRIWTRDGVQFTYDEIGNTLYDGEWNYTWERGRQLKSMSNGSTTWNMTYDVDGLRTSRIVGSNKYYYYYHDGLLTYMKYNSLVMRFTYDAQGRPVSMTYNGNTYYYALNLQGDVMALLDSSGNEVVSYHYNAWGKLLNTTASTTGILNSLAKYNPLRYRGYVYDRETGLYYLQSRYYIPEICRFISPDNVELLGSNGDVLSYNLYAYCSNNPVIRADQNGRFWHLVVGGVIGGIIGAISSAASGGDVVDVLIGAAAGAAGGVLAASGAGVVVQALGSAAISMVSNAASQVNHIVQDETGETTFDVRDMAFDGAVGLACGIWGGNGASYGNSGGIMAAGKQLFKRGFFDPRARSYYAKVAHNMGGEYVFKPLLKSLGKSAIGSSVVATKNRLFN